MQKEYTQNQLDQLMENLEKEFSVALALAKSETGESAASVDGSEVLAKAEEEKKPEAKDEKAEEKKDDESKSDEKPAAEAKEAPKAEEAPAKEEGKEEAPAAEAKEAEKPAAAEGEDHCDYDEEDMDHMHKMYASMSKGELRAHHDAIKKTLDGMGMAKCGDQAVMAKSEGETSVEVKTEVVAEATPEVELLKSEVSAKDAKIQELQKNLDVATEFLTKLFSKKSAPAGKAITNLEAIEKSEKLPVDEKPLTKGEITERLIKKAADPNLNAADRQAINAYYLNGASINKISHLLK